MIYHHPLAYLVGMEGLALLRAYSGDFDRDFVLERLAEVRRLLDEPSLAAHPGVELVRRDAPSGYAVAAPTYDDPHNGLFAIDEAIVDEILEGLPVGDALDAACGTGRFAARLAQRGYGVVGVDSSEDMLALAQAKLPDAEFRRGELTALPVEDASVDLVICALALTHVPNLAPVMAEFARVVRPGGHVVITDAHHELVFRGSVVKGIGADGALGVTVNYRHTPGDFLRAALGVGLQVRHCEEPGRPSESEVVDAGPMPDVLDVEDPATWPWTLLPLVPSAAQAAWSTPAVIVWDFERSAT